MTLRRHQLRAFLLTYLAYTCIHLVRKPISIIKSVWHPQHDYDPLLNPGWKPFNDDLDPKRIGKVGLIISGFSKSVDGKYPCKKFEDSSLDLCLIFYRDGYFIQREAGKICQSLVVNSHYNERFCWVITHQGQLLPDAIQFEHGLYPRPVVPNDRKEYQWYRLRNDEEDGKTKPGLYQIDPFIRVYANLLDGKLLMGWLDTCFMLAYTVGMMMAGKVADIVEIRHFLLIGMVGAGMFSILMGSAHRFEIHSYWYFVCMSVGAGLCQSVAWPCVVAIMGRWFKTNRGLLLGVWNSHISLGNALGSIVATACVSWGLQSHDWPLGFEVPGCIIITCAVFVWCFIETDPLKSNIVIENNNHEESLLAETNDNAEHENQVPPSLYRALQIPNVPSFSACMFFAKMTTNALLFWGPLYLSNDVGFSSEHAGYLCSFFDIGGCLGGFLAGLASDRTKGKHGIVALAFLIVSAPALLAYYAITHSYGPETALNIVMMIVIGTFVNGPVALITTAVSADLGNHPSLKNDKRLAATVAGLIDSSGSLGSAVQGVVIGFIASRFSWGAVWSLLGLGSLIAAVCLFKVVRKEL